MSELNLKHLVKSVAATKDGEDLLLALEAKYNARLSFVVGDSHLTAYNEGQRSVVMELLGYLATEESQKE